MLGRIRRKLARESLRVWEAALAVMPAPLSLSLQFRQVHGRWPDLKNPKSFSEKIQWRKLHDRDPRLVVWSDKVQAKRLAATALGPDWVIPTLWSGDRLPPRAERDWPKPYVLKANHGSGMNLFIRSAADEDWDRIERTTRRWMRGRFLPHLHERHYDRIERRLLVEPLVGDPSTTPVDYKFFCFAGRAEFIMVHMDRHTALKIATFDRHWRAQALAHTYPWPEHDVPRPASWDAMLAAAERLATGFDFVRVDFYEIDGRPLFGETTFFPGSGRELMEPYEINLRFGALWPMPGDAEARPDEPERARAA
jgi:hypothetical protein